MAAEQAPAQAQAPFFAFSVQDWNKKQFDFAQLQGKVTLIVNVASQCGFTSQYKGLQGLYDKYKDQGLVIIGFPCNQFGGQEPAAEDQIHEFCSRTYNVSFPIMSKIEVNGDKTSPVYQYLKSQQKQLLMERIKWNFEKFLVNKQGQVVGRYSSMATPESIDADIAKLLTAQ